MILASECNYASPIKIKVRLYTHLIIDRIYVAWWFSICVVSVCKKITLEVSLVVQWLRFRTFTALDLGLIPGWRTKIPHPAFYVLNKKNFLVNVNLLAF